MLTVEEISDRLIHLPGEISRQAEIVEDKKYTWEKAKLTEEVTEAKRTMELKAEKAAGNKLSEATIELMVTEQYLPERIAVLGMESTYRKERAKLKNFEDEFDATKALAYLKQREIKGGID